MEKNMLENFEKLQDRLSYSLKNTDLERINYKLEKINEPTLVSGVGGSSVVSEFASKILNIKNHIITRNTEPRDFKYLDLNGYKNVLACSYSGNNYGVELAFENNLKHYLLSCKESDNEEINHLTYNVDEKEKSFISLSATLIPCTVLLNYYLSDDYDIGFYKDYICDQLKDSYEYSFDVTCDFYEIFSGVDTSAASKYLESTMIESGIGIPIVHDKYSYCHGRSTTCINNNNIAIYFDTHKELDKVLLEEIKKYYKDVIVIDSKDKVIGDYICLIKSIYLTKYLAEQKNKDLSGVDYCPIVKKVYKYNGEL